MSGVERKPPPRGIDDSSLVSRRDRYYGIIGGDAHLDLDGNQGAAATHDQIQFTDRGAQTAGERPVAKAEIELSLIHH